MALKTGERVERPYNQVDREETVFLNETEVQGRTVQPQNKLRVLNPSIMGAGTNTVTATEDIILTYVNWIIFNNAPAGVTVNAIYINGEEVFVTGGSSLAFEYDGFPLPNILIRAGEVVSVNSLDTSGTLQFEVKILGYKA